MLLGIADGFFFCPLPQSSAGIFVRSVHALFHSDVSRYLFRQGQPSRCRLNTSVLCSPQAAQMHTCQSCTCKFAIFGINFSLFVGFQARHDFRSLRKKIPFTYLSAGIVAIDTHNLRDPQSSRPTLSKCVSCHSDVVILQLLIGPLDWTRKIETTSSWKNIYSAKSHTNENSLGS